MNCRNKACFAWQLLVTAVAMAVVAGLSTAHAQEIKIAGTGSALGTMKLLTQAYAKAHPSVAFAVLPSMGSSGGIKALLAGAIQIGVSSRPLKDEEIKAGAVAIEYGRTPFVFATAANNKTTGVTTQNLADWYAGKINTWPDGSKLRLVLRPIGDSDSVMIKNMSPTMRDAKTLAEQRKGMLFAITDQETADVIEKTPGAMGPSTLAQILSEKRSMKALALDGVAPSAQTITSGMYPLFKSMLLITGPETSPEAMAFVSFVLRSPIAREILQQTGHGIN